MESLGFLGLPNMRQVLPVPTSWLPWVSIQVHPSKSTITTTYTEIKSSFFNIPCPVAFIFHSNIKYQITLQGTYKSRLYIISRKKAKAMLSTSEFPVYLKLTAEQSKKQEVEERDPERSGCKHMYIHGESIYLVNIKPLWRVNQKVESKSLLVHKHLMRMNKFPVTVRAESEKSSV